MTDIFYRFYPPGSLYQIMYNHSFAKSSGERDATAHLCLTSQFMILSNHVEMHPKRNKELNQVSERLNEHQDKY